MLKLISHYCPIKLPEYEVGYIDSVMIESSAIILSASITSRTSGLAMLIGLLQRGHSALCILFRDYRYLRKQLGRKTQFSEHVSPTISSLAPNVFKQMPQSK